MKRGFKKCWQKKGSESASSCCSREVLQGSGIFYLVNIRTRQPYLKIMAYRNRVIICTSEGLQEKMRALLKGKNRDEIFENPFVYGQTIHYVPAPAASAVPARPGFAYEFLSGTELLPLEGLTGFENSLELGEGESLQGKAACTAKDGGRIAGVAGAGEVSAGIWEAGVDVLEEYRNARLGSSLVSLLTGELLKRDILPFYSASVTNLGSQMVASRCGYIPLWVDTFGTHFGQQLCI